MANQKPELDIDTQKILIEGGQLKTLVGSEGWSVARDFLMQQIIDLQSIRNITATDPTEVIIDIKARTVAIDIILEWLRQVEGTARQHEGNKVILEETDAITRLEE